LDSSELVTAMAEWMDRYDREQLIEQIKQDQAQRIADIAERQAKRDAGVEDEWQVPAAQEPRQKRAAPEIVYKNYERSATAVQNDAGWNAWALALIDQRIRKNNAVVAEILAEEYVPRHIAKAAIDALRADIAELRGKVAVLEGLLKGSVISLAAKDKSNAA